MHLPNLPKFQQQMAINLPSRNTSLGFGGKSLNFTPSPSSNHKFIKPVSLELPSKQTNVHTSSFISHIPFKLVEDNRSQVIFYLILCFFLIRFSF